MPDHAMPDHAMPDPSAGSKPAAWNSAAVRDEAGLVSTAQLMVFKPGVYAVSLHVVRSTATDIGLKLPSVRLDALPPAAAADGRAFVSTTAEGGWISRGSDQVFILVAGGAARVILTTYKAGADAAAPEIRITNISQDALAPGSLRLPSERALQAAGTAIPEPARSAGETSVEGLALGIVAHAITGAGCAAGPGEWAGLPGVALEGFTLTLPAGPLEYQAIMGSDWDTPWFGAGVFCGSRGLSLALLGFRVRLLPPLAASHRCSYWGRFKGGEVAGPFTDGAACSLGERELEAIRLVIEPRADAVDSAPPRPARRARGRRKPASGVE